jgi:hypothetical protein
MDPSIYTSNLPLLKQKLTNILSHGPSKLKIVTDFDSTLTDPNGWSSWCVIERRPELSDEFRQGIINLANHFAPFELDPKLSLSEKQDKMELWRQGAIEVLLKERIEWDMYKKIANESSKFITFRPNVKELFELIYKLDIPMVIFSAGIGDFIDAVVYDCVPHLYVPCVEGLHCGNGKESNPNGEKFNHNDQVSRIHQSDQKRLVRLIANYLLLEELSTEGYDTNHDENHTCGEIGQNTDSVSANNTKTNAKKYIKSLLEPPINVLNKAEAIIQTESYYTSQMKPRYNSIVIGDAIGDSKMINDAVDSHNVIRVGFFQQRDSNGDNLPIITTPDLYPSLPSPSDLITILETHDSFEYKELPTKLKQFLNNFDIVFVNSHDGIQWVNDIINSLGQDVLLGSNAVGLIEGVEDRIDRNVQRLSGIVQVEVVRSKREGLEGL